MEENGIFVALLTIHATVMSLFITISYAIYSYYNSRKNELITEIGDYLYDYISEVGLNSKDGKIAYEVNDKTYENLNHLVLEETKRLYFDVSDNCVEHIKKKPSDEEISKSYTPITRSYFVFLRENMLFEKKERDCIHLKIDAEVKNKVDQMIQITDGVSFSRQPIFSPPTLLEKISTDARELYKKDPMTYSSLSVTGAAEGIFEKFISGCDKYLIPAKKNFHKIESIESSYISYKTISRVAIFEIIFGILLPLLLINGLPINVLKFGVYDPSTWTGYFLAFITLVPYAYYISNPEKILQKNRHTSDTPNH